MKIWFLRHQAGGIVWEYPFAAEPTNAQIAPIAELMHARHGYVNKKGDAYWINAFPVDVVGEEVPLVKLPGSSSVSSAAMPGAQVHGEGTVKNP